MGKDLVAASVYQPEPTTAAAARRFVRDTLGAWMVAGVAADGQGLVDDAVLLTSELVTNAVVHAGTAVRVTCKLVNGAVEVLVSDGHPARPLREAPADDTDPGERTSGRGLLLPAALASSWGVTYERSAKVVWFRLGLGGLRPMPQDGAQSGCPATGDSELDVLANRMVLPVERLSGEGAAAPGTDGAPGEPGYRELLVSAVEAARAELAADAAVAVMVGEEGDLRLRAVAGALPHLAGEPARHDGAVGDGRGILAALQASVRAGLSVVTAPFIVDGQVTGLLATIAGAGGRSGDAAAVALQALADSCAPLLQRVWLGEMERVRRERIAALGEARGLLGPGLAEADIMALAGQVTVPRLAPWCAVLVRAKGQGLRTAYARHGDAARQEALVWLLDRLCGTDSVPGEPPGEGLGWRWPVAVTTLVGAPAGARECAADAPWCFPLGTSGETQGLFVVGSGGGHRLPREVSALSADLACRIGLALTAARPVDPRLAAGA